MKILIALFTSLLFLPSVLAQDEFVKTDFLKCIFDIPQKPSSPPEISQFLHTVKSSEFAYTKTDRKNRVAFQGRGSIKNVSMQRKLKLEFLSESRPKGQIRYKTNQTVFFVAECSDSARIKDTTYVFALAESSHYSEQNYFGQINGKTKLVNVIGFDQSHAWDAGEYHELVIYFDNSDNLEAGKFYNIRLDTFSWYKFSNVWSVTDIDQNNILGTIKILQVGDKEMKIRYNVSIPIPSRSLLVVYQGDRTLKKKKLID